MPHDHLPLGASGPANVPGAQDASSGDAVRPIRALLRGLETLEALNRHDGLTVSEVAQATRLPRTTVYRILETLCVGGYVARDAGDERYRPTVRASGLADGFLDEPWIRDDAAGLVEDLCRKILWPLMFSTPNPRGLLLRVVTDRLSPVALRRYTAGGVLPLTQTAGGMVRLATATQAERETLLAIAESEGAPAADINQARAGAEVARDRGFALDLRTIAGESSVAVPVRDRRDEVRGILCMRFIRSALSADRIVEEFVPQLRTLADAIAAVAPVDTEAGSRRLITA